MHRRLGHLMGLVLLLLVSGAAQGGVFRDSFDTPRDYLTEGVGNTGWDGFLGKNPGETVSTLNASKDRPGELHMASAGGYWPGATLGPFLYRVVAGDFVATVKVTNYTTVAYNYCGLMARVANVADAGAGEDWVSIDYFPQYGVGNIAHYCNDGTRQETAGGANRATPHAYLQLERVGNDFYLRTSTDGVTWVNYPGTMYYPLTRDDMAGLPVQVGIWQATHTANPGDVAFDDFTLSGSGVVVGNQAYNARPVGNSTDVLRDSVLSWTPAEGAAAHDVYIGTVLADVDAADKTSPLCVAKAQEPNTYNPGRLEFGKTYYWRIDEVGANGQLIAGGKGGVWTFTVEPYSILIADVNAVADSAFDTQSLAVKSVNGSGLDAATNLHGMTTADMWVSNYAPFPHWIQYRFDKAYKLDKMWAWNSNQPMEGMFGLGAKDVTVQYSLDGDTWTDLGNFVFVQATGLAPCGPDTVVPFDGVTAKYVKLSITSNWGGKLPCGSLSEVRFFSIPVSARSPKPASGTTGLHPQVAMSWRSGREADSHELYLSTDPNAVANGTAQKTTLSQANYDLAANLETTYYWQVVEVNQAQTPTSWAGEVWNFATAQYLAVDDFEGYTNDSPFRVFQAWIDGSGFSADDFFPNGGAGNGSGSLIGYDPQLGDIMETTTVYPGGRQSMPFFFDNGAAAKISEATHSFSAKEVTDWTKYGITTLTLFFRGDPNNGPAPIYLKINGAKILYNNGAAATTLPMWKQWNIPLASVTGVDFKAVKTLTIGIGDGAGAGSGKMLFDEIRLYATAPAIPVPADPGANGLAASYSFDGNLNDSAGGYNGTPNGDPGYTTGKTGFAKALGFDGTNDYIDLPVAPLLSTLSSTTFAVWVNVYNAGDTWSRVFDFGTGTTVNMFLTPYAGSNTRFAITTSGVGGESRVTAPRAKSNGWHHIAVVIDSAAMALRLYEDGTMVRSGTTGVLPKDLGTTTSNWLGRSIYNDDYFNGALNDFRIYNRALSDGEIRYLAGER